MVIRQGRAPIYFLNRALLKLNPALCINGTLVKEVYRWV